MIRSRMPHRGDTESVHNPSPSPRRCHHSRCNSILIMQMWPTKSQHLEMRKTEATKYMLLFILTKGKKEKPPPLRCYFLKDRAETSAWLIGSFHVMGKGSSLCTMRVARTYSSYKHQHVRFSSNQTSTFAWQISIPVRHFLLARLYDFSRTKSM